MRLLGIIDNDFVNYKKISMTLEFPYCTFKCNKEYGAPICQNFEQAKSAIKDYKINDIIKLYLDDPLSEAIVMQGLEPFDSFEEVLRFIKAFRIVSKDDIVIYTGYRSGEVLTYIEALRPFENIIIKFGRFIPNQDPHRDHVLGIDLISDNQYAVKIENI